MWDNECNLDGEPEYSQRMYGLSLLSPGLDDLVLLISFHNLHLRLEAAALYKMPCSKRSRRRRMLCDMTTSDDDVASKKSKKNSARTDFESVAGLRCRIAELCKRSKLNRKIQTRKIHGFWSRFWDQNPSILSTVFYPSSSLFVCNTRHILATFRRLFDIDLWRIAVRLYGVLL